ncbi:MAG: hypothetical protein WA112_08750 [Rugosibacter sp.]|jgi:hypothetical protein|nr:hypothetical protein [Rugosibacter sp.]
MPDYELIPGLYLGPTPAGAYYAVSSPNEDPSRRILLNLMKAETSPALTLDNLGALTGLASAQALEHLYHLQARHLVQGLHEVSRLPEGNLERVLPGILADLAGRNKALLADEQGFYLASHGFHHETAEELAGLSADVGNLHQRHRGLIAGNLSVQTSAWALINAGGNSEIGFWPLYIGQQRFVLILTGLPRLNHAATVRLVWALARRYGE